MLIDGNGSTVTYTGQPLSSLPTPISYPPATTSSCTTYAHSELFQTIVSLLKLKGIGNDALGLAPYDRTWW